MTNSQPTGFKKGDMVSIKAQTTATRIGAPHLKYRALQTIPYPTPKRGIVLGYSFIRTGKIEGGNPDMYDYEPGYLIDITDNKVWVIELFEKGNRYLEPVRCLEGNIELIQKTNRLSSIS